MSRSAGPPLKVENVSHKNPTLIQTSKLRGRANGPKPPETAVATNDMRTARFFVAVSRQCMKYCMIKRKCMHSYRRASSTNSSEEAPSQLSSRSPLSFPGPQLGNYVCVQTLNSYGVSSICHSWGLLPHSWGPRPP